MMRWSSRWLGWTTAVLLAVTVVMGLWITPPDQVQGNLVRLLYIHPAIAWVALYVSFGTAVVAAGLYLWPRTRSLEMDRVSYCAMEISVVCIALTLVTGSIWGRPTWGVWWAWDARLTSTAILGVFEVAYLALRRANDDVEVRARRSAVFTLLTAINVPIIHFSVIWWKTLHQGASVLTATGSLNVHGTMLTTMLLSFVGFTTLFFWFLLRRVALESRRDARRTGELDSALEMRRREGVG